MASVNDEADIDTSFSSSDPRITGLLTEYHWSLSARDNFQFTIPDSETDYEDTRDLLVDDYPDDNHIGVVAMPTFMVTGIRDAIAEYNRILPFRITEQSDNNVDTQLRYGLADLTHDGDQPPPPAYAWTPQDDGLFSEQDNWKSGDMFYNIDDFSTAPMIGGVTVTELVGTWEYHTILHETGHALGLKHGHETDEDTEFGPLPSEWDSMEFSVMTYRGYIGDTPGGGYQVVDGHYAQTLMMLDIQALQYLYGADFTTNQGNTVYRWDTQGRYFVNGALQWDVHSDVIFLTVWDGDGNDTYDFSAFSSNQVISLEPGRWSTVARGQLAQLGPDPASNAFQTARGNVFNALLYEKDERSLIENAIGGSGNDTITGNIAGNKLTGGGGDDRLDGKEGDDTLTGGAGADVLQGWDGIDFAAYTATAGENVTITPFGNPTAGSWRVAGSAQAAGDVLMRIEGFVFGSGDDTIRVARVAGGEHVAAVNAGAGNDVIHGSDEADTLIGGAGSDTLRPNEGPFEAFGGTPGKEPETWVENLADNDLLVIDRSRYGGTYTFTVDFSPSPLDTFVGDDGSTARGIARFDYTGSGFLDLVEGARGRDTIRGFGGDDDFEGRGGHDRLEGGTGNDFLIGGSGNDTLRGGTGTDFLDGSAGNDRIETGGGGDSSVYGNNGNDTILGSKDGEGAFGGAGNDSIRALAGDDNLFGEAGNDTLDAGEGEDLMTGGPGRDVFVFAPKGGRDDVTDFDANPAGGQDRLDVSAYNFKNFADMLASGVRITGGFSTLVDLGNTEINLATVPPGSIGGQDFIFS